MSRSKLFAVLIVVPFVLVVAMIDGAVAAEKVNLQGTSVTTNSQSMEVGDEEGHMLIIFESKQIYINQNTGEKSVSTTKNMMDINVKTGQGTLKGYGETTYPNGDKIFRVHEGKPVGKGHWQGTHSYLKGTGKYEGVKGKGTWDSYSLAPQMSYMEIDGEVEMPK
jgi:hypothetical protein